MHAKVKKPTQTLKAKRRDFSIRRKNHDFSKSYRPPVSQVINLQRTIGNQAVQGLFKSGAIQINRQTGKPLNNKWREADRLVKGVVQTTPVPGFQVIYRQEGEDEKVPTMSDVQDQERPEEGKLLQGKIEYAQSQIESPEEDELMQGKFNNFQCQEAPDAEEELQMKAVPGNRQRQEAGEDKLLQGKSKTSETAIQLQSDGGMGESHTDMPRPLKAGLESLSGIDLSGVRVHKNSSKPAQIGALAYTKGQDIHVGSGHEKHLPHEGWHAVQQIQGRVKPTMQTKGISINDDPGLEREADVKGAQAIHMSRASMNQGQRNHQMGMSLRREVQTGGKAEWSRFPSIDKSKRMPDTSLSRGIIQRFAFINENQVLKAAKGMTSEMKTMVSDNLVRNYMSIEEFEKHAAKKTDYLGNLVGKAKPGLWVRFSPSGMNILGENHTKVQLGDVTPAVGSKNFINEQFSSDDLKKNPNMKAAYEEANNLEFKRFGIEKEADKQKFGSESLYPKMGFALTLAIPYFAKKEPISDLQPPNYLGKPIQRYLKIAWGHSKDNILLVNQKNAAKTNVPPKMSKLASVHKSVETALDKFITSLPVDGYIGDELAKKKNATLFKPLAEFSHAFTEAMVELAASEKSSRLSKSERKKLFSAKSTSEAQKMQLFGKWRNYYFEDVVKAAAKRGVRYAGMGQAHLDYLKKVGLPPNGHPYEMDGIDIQKFEALTKKLAKKAKKI